MRKFVFVAVAFLATVPAFAKVVTYEYTGVIGSIVDTANGRGRQVASSSSLPGSLAIGDAFHGRFSYDTSLPLTGNTAESASYQSLIWGSGTPTPASTFVVDRSGASFTMSASAPSLYVNKTQTYSSFSAYTGAFTPSGYTTLGFSFFDDRPGTLPSLAVPTALNLDDFWNPSVSFNLLSTSGNFMSGQGLITSLNNVSPVPEPEAYMFWAAGFALAGATSLRKRYRSKAE